MALDIAFNAAPITPTCASTRSGSCKRPDGTIQYAENPPKKYQDIYPFDFETDGLAGAVGGAEERGRVLDRAGVRVFRVDNPHTKPFAFWEWLIGEVRARAPRGHFSRPRRSRAPR